MEILGQSQQLFPQLPYHFFSQKMLETINIGFLNSAMKS